MASSGLGLCPLFPGWMKGGRRELLSLLLGLRGPEREVPVPGFWRGNHPSGSRPASHHQIDFWEWTGGHSLFVFRIRPGTRLAESRGKFLRQREAQGGPVPSGCRSEPGCRSPGPVSRWSRGDPTSALLPRGRAIPERWRGRLGRRRRGGREAGRRSSSCERN